MATTSKSMETGPDRPLHRVPIPNTDGWLRVTTTHGNVFYAQKKTKRSEWTIPSEIHTQVLEFERALGIEPISDDSQDEKERSHKRLRLEEHQHGEVSLRSGEDVCGAEHPTEAKGEQLEQNEASTIEHKDEFADLAFEEGKAMYMEMLTSLNGTPREVNPMAPWDHELPKFVHERAYRALPTLEDREDVFNEWCKFRLREKRSQSKTSSSEKAFSALLKKQVASTRTDFTAFREAFRHDPAYVALLRDSNEQKAQRMFHSWLAELRELKLKMAHEAEQAYIHLLNEYISSEEFDVPRHALDREAAQQVWAKAKKTPGLSADPRYDAVGSATRRFELFHQWLGGAVPTTSTHRSKAERRAQALEQREAQVRRERARQARQADLARSDALVEQRETEFRQYLIDTVRDPWITWTDASSFASSFHSEMERGVVTDARKRQMFEEHLQHLRSRRRDQLARLFEKHSLNERGVPQLNRTADVVLPLVRADDEYIRSPLPRFVGEDTGVHKRAVGTNLEAEFDAWDAWRQERAQQEFFTMLRENAFVDFWGRLQKEKQAKRDDEMSPALHGEDEADDDEETTVSLLDMASQLDIQAMESVLKVCVTATTHSLTITGG